MTDAPDPAVLFPRLLSLPLAIVPDGVHSAAIVAVLNQVLASALHDGELDYLQGRTVRIRVTDMQLGFRITWQEGRLAAGTATHTADLSITGTLHAFLQLAARHEDTDTLFFQRRLRMEGDTELGLEVKNFLDGLDVDARWLPRQASKLTRKLLPLYERTFG